MAYMISRFEQDNLHLKNVEESKDKEILLWAAKKKYITLVRFSKNLYYAEEELEKALMWNKKDDSKRTEVN